MIDCCSRYMLIAALVGSVDVWTHVKKLVLSSCSWHWQRDATVGRRSCPL